MFDRVDGGGEQGLLRGGDLPVAAQVVRLFGGELGEQRAFCIDNAVFVNQENEFFGTYGQGGCLRDFLHAELVHLPGGGHGQRRNQHHGAIVQRVFDGGAVHFAHHAGVCHVDAADNAHRLCEHEVARADVQARRALRRMRESQRQSSLHIELNLSAGLFGMAQQGFAAHGAAVVVLRFVARLAAQCGDLRVGIVHQHQTDAQRGHQVQIGGQIGQHVGRE